MDMETEVDVYQCRDCPNRGTHFWYDTAPQAFDDGAIGVIRCQHCDGLGDDTGETMLPQPRTSIMVTDRQRKVAALLRAYRALRSDGDDPNEPTILLFGNPPTAAFLHGENTMVQAIIHEAKQRNVGHR